MFFESWVFNVSIFRFLKIGFLTVRFFVFRKLGFNGLIFRFFKNQFLTVLFLSLFFGRTLFYFSEFAEVEFLVFVFGSLFLRIVWRVDLFGFLVEVGFTNCTPVSENSLFGVLRWYFIGELYPLLLRIYWFLFSENQKVFCYDYCHSSFCWEFLFN